MYNFEFVKPSSISEAVTALTDEEATPLSGGQTLLPTMKQRLANPEKLVSLAGIAEMQGVTEADGMVHIGAATTHATVAAKAQSYPDWQSLRRISVILLCATGARLADLWPITTLQLAIRQRLWRRMPRLSQIRARLRRMITFRVCSARRWAKARS